MASGLEAWVRRQVGMSRAIVPALRSGFRAFGLSCSFPNSVLWPTRPDFRNPGKNIIS